MNILKKINSNFDKKISILITEKITYKGKDYLPNQIYFVDQETYTDFEFISSLANKTICYTVNVYKL